MKFVIASLLLVAGFLALSSVEASAVVCARGVYRAGCVAPGGAVVVGRPVVAPRDPLCAAGCIDHLAVRLAVGRGFGATSMISTKLPLWLTPWRARFKFVPGSTAVASVAGAFEGRLIWI
jgi:hypothetical protein